MDGRLEKPVYASDRRLEQPVYASLSKNIVGLRKQAFLFTSIIVVSVLVVVKPADKDDGKKDDLVLVWMTEDLTFSNPTYCQTDKQQNTYVVFL